MRVFDKSVYDVTGKEMDTMYPCCEGQCGCKCPMAHCTAVVVLANTSEEEWDTYKGKMWCLRKDGGGKF